MRFDVWGMTGTLLVSEPSVQQRAEEELWSWIDRANRSVNRFLAKSEITRLNTQGCLDDASEDFLMFLDVARDAAALTDGLVDPTVLPSLVAWGYDDDFDAVKSRAVSAQPSAPSAGISHVSVHGRRVTSPSGLDFGASAKAFVADAVASAIEPHSGVLVEIGGDVAVRTSARGEPWVIGVASESVGDTAPRISVATGGVATSSTTFRSWTTSHGRAHHIIDPRSGNPASSQWSTITVAAPSCLYANALATAGFIWDDDAPWHIAQTGWAGRLVRHDGTVVTVGSWPKDGE